MSDLYDLYQDMILDHNKNPRNYGELDQADRHADGFNPLCGDKITVYLKVREGRIEDVRFKGSGCAISQASASMMTESLKGKTIEEAKRLFQGFHHLVTQGNAGEEAPDLGKLEVFSGVFEFPARVKCASLAWHTMKAALDDADRTISTE